MDNIANSFKTMLHPLVPIHACMHATNPPRNHQIPHLTHAQQHKIGKLAITNNSNPSNHKTQNGHQNPKIESHDMMTIQSTLIKELTTTKATPQIKPNTILQTCTLVLITCTPKNTHMDPQIHTHHSPCQ
jgi:hypothetical protein